MIKIEISAIVSKKDIEFQDDGRIKIFITKRLNSNEKYTKTKKRTRERATYLIVFNIVKSRELMDLFTTEDYVKVVGVMDAIPKVNIKRIPYLLLKNDANIEQVKLFKLTNAEKLSEGISI